METTNGNYEETQTPFIKTHGKLIAKLITACARAGRTAYANTFIPSFINSFKKCQDCWGKEHIPTKLVQLHWASSASQPVFCVTNSRRRSCAGSCRTTIPRICCNCCLITQIFIILYYYIFAFTILYIFIEIIFYFNFLILFYFVL